MNVKLICFILSFGLCLRMNPVNAYTWPTNLKDWSAADWSWDTKMSSFTNSPFDKTNDAGRPFCSWLREQPDVTVFVLETTARPLKYTNLISNTNLFSANERDLLQKLFDKYEKLKTNVSESVRTKPGDGYDVTYAPAGTFPYSLLDGLPKETRPTNQPNMEMFPDIVPISYRSPMKLQEIKHNQLNGIRVELYGGHPVSLLHFKDDKAVGDWFNWSTNGNLRLHVRFNKPYPLFENMMYNW
jgi:hypothetical protein